MSHGYKIENGMLAGPEGSWQLSKISSVCKRTGDKLSWEKWLLFTAALAAASWPGVAILWGAPIALGAFAYFTHQTKRVYIVADGTEVEIHSSVYILNVPYWTEGEANYVCDDLVELVQKHIG